MRSSHSLSRKIFKIFVSFKNKKMFKSVAQIFVVLSRLIFKSSFMNEYKYKSVHSCEASQLIARV